MVEPELDSDDQFRARAAIGVAATWVVLVAIAQVLVATVVVHSLPSSVFIFVLGAAGGAHPVLFATPDLMVVAWTVIGACAVLVALAAVLLRRYYVVAMTVGFLVSGILPFVASSILVSLMGQTGLTAPPDSLSSFSRNAAGIVGGVFLIGGFVSVASIPRWLFSRAQKRRNRHPDRDGAASSSEGL